MDNYRVPSTAQGDTIPTLDFIKVDQGYNLPNEIFVLNIEVFQIKFS